MLQAPPGRVDPAMLVQLALAPNTLELPYET
jgi:hypothetical protein